ncbi:MAG: acyl-CoA dehydrogenase family protein [Paucibacter sp.]|nr:acyl-CoA dehydrogenase family protein [Roseateles sp.]
MGQQTHQVHNQFDELVGYNLFDTDLALQEAVRAAGAGWAAPELSVHGAEVGSAQSFEEAALANRHPPELQAFDGRGRRIDRVDFHPAWHAQMARLRGAGLVSNSFRGERAGRWVAHSAGMYLQGQVEAGSTCPSVMTWAAIPLLQREPQLWAELGEKLMSREYDARDVPIAKKCSIYIGMGMTEKQGGSDVRANTTTATPVGAGGRGRPYLIRGHKWFFSAPMCDAHLVVAQIAGVGPSCFFVPRWRPDGSKNPVLIQRLKDKLGNQSNSSSEVEFDDALGFLMGEEGRGIPTIIEMANYTRLACVVGSAAFIRQGLVQALAYARQRKAFGRALAEQPLMRSVLADMVVESEAALVLSLRLSQAFEHGDEPAERLWKRVITPAAKFWICKRAVELSGEAMEVFGGNGYVETGPMARLYRETPVHSIWEGSGNVMCLDVMRAFAREPEGVFALLAELGEAAGGDKLVSARIERLRALLGGAPDLLEARGRQVAQDLVLVTQAALLRRQAPAFVADAFMATRLGNQGWGAVVGVIDPGSIDVQALLERALPDDA